MLRAAARAAVRAGGVKSSSGSGSLHHRGLLHRPPAAAAPAAAGRHIINFAARSRGLSSSTSSSSSSSSEPPSAAATASAAERQPSSRRRPSPRRGGSSGRKSPAAAASSTQPTATTALPLDLASYRRLVADAPNPSVALSLLEEMRQAGLSFDAEAALLALRLCTLHDPRRHLRDGLRLLRRLTTTTTTASHHHAGPHPSHSPVAHAAYALALAGCVRAVTAAAGGGGGSSSQEGQGQQEQGQGQEASVLAAMRRHGVRPGVGIYQEVARACLEPAAHDAAGRARALAVLRAVLEMEPASEEAGEPQQGEDGQQQQQGQRVSVKCRSEGEAAWVQALLLAARGRGGNRAADVDAALALLAKGLQAFAPASSEGSPSPSSSSSTGETQAPSSSSACAFACNVVLAACIRAGRWGEAAAVEELMRGLRAAPDAWAVNSLLARALKDEEVGKLGRGLAASRLLQGLLSAHPQLTPSPSAYRALLEHGGCDALLDLLAAMQRTRGAGAVPAYAYRMLLRALDDGEGGEARLVGEGLPLVAHRDA